MSRRAWIGTLAVCLLVSGGVAVGKPGALAPLTFREHFHVLPYTGAAVDGQYTLLSTTVQGQVGVALNEQTGTKTPVWLPADCPAPAGVPLLGGSWVLVDCTTSRVDLYSLAGGDWRPVTVAAGCQNFHAGRGSSCTLYAIGSDWIAYDESSSHLGDRFVFQNIVSGALRRNPSNARTIVNLNSPTLAHRLCDPLRVPVDGSLTPDGRLAVVRGPAGVFVERCGSTLRIALPLIATAAVGPGAELGTSLIWSTPGSKDLDGIFLPSLRRFRIVVTAARHTEIIAAQAGERSVYLEALPRAGQYAGELLSAPLPSLGLSSRLRSGALRGRRSVVEIAHADPVDPNLVAARTDAARILALVPPAPGAAVQSVDPYTGKLWAPPYALGPWQAVATGHWLVPEPVTTVQSFITAHQPPHARQIAFTTGSGDGWSETLSFPTAPGSITSATVEIDVGPYGRSEAELSAVVRVLWRPTWEQIPTATRSLAVSVDRGPTLIVTGQRRIDALARLFAGLSVVGPGSYSCPLALNPVTAVVSLRGDRGSRLGRMLVDDSGCNWVYFRLGNRRAAPLGDDGVLDLLWRERGVLPCRASQLSGTVAPVSRDGETESVAIKLKNTSAGECSVDGFPKLELLTPHGHTLKARVRHVKRLPAGLATAAPGQVLAFTVSWRRGRTRCPARTVGAFAIEMTRVPGRLEATTATPVSICRGPVTVSPLSGSLL